MNGEMLFEATDWFRPFPRPEDVFANDVERHAEYLLPLATIELSHVRPDWSGSLHFVLPIEPHDGLVGDESQGYHTYLCRENWVGYRIIDGKYQLACDFEYFIKARFDAGVEKHRTAPGERAGLEEHYAEARKGFQLREQHFREYGCLHHCFAEKGKSGRYSDDDRTALVHELGGGSGAGNWADPSDFPLSFHDRGEEYGREARPLTEDGREFEYIGCIVGQDYVVENCDIGFVCCCDLLLFYDPQDQIALTTFDWS